MAEPRRAAGDADRTSAAAAAERHARLREIVLAADRLSGPERERLIGEKCRDDEDLARAAREVLAGSQVATRDVVPGTPFAPVVVAADETPERLGPFRVLREIGRGGMGVVYEAEDERSGRRVAVKAIREELLGNARVEERFAREATAGAQVDHPNVVRTIGVERVPAARGPSRCLLVTELVEGRTLRALVRSLGVVPESLVREIGLGMARGLAAVHTAGVVHRDLKPENVLLTTDGRVRIMDLGIARMLDRDDRLTRDGDFVGSPEYAAPEQCDGRDVGPSADLYALGVVLFELSSGRNPFARPSTLATVAAHLSQSAPPLAAEAEGVSEFLAAVVAKLLAKQPDARFDSAETLVRTLEEGEDGAWWRGRRSPCAAESRSSPRVPVARDLALRGRRKELAALLDLWDAARRGRGATAFVTGEAGLGKTRLLDAFLASVEPKETHRIYASVSSGGEISGIGEALLGVLGWNAAETWLAEHAAMPPALASSFAAFLRSEPPPSGVAALSRDAVSAAFLRTLRALASERPTMLALDDVHAAGPEASALILSLARGLAEAPVLLVLAARTDGAARWTADLATLPGLRPVALARLSSEDVTEILREALGSEDLARRAARRIAAKSGGVPLYVAAMLAALRDAVAAGPDGGLERTLETIEVPMALRGALAARLAGLDADERTLLDACAVQGPRFDAGLAAEVLGLPFVRALQALAAVERRLGVVRTDGRAFRFDHQLLADEVAGALPPALREEYHLRTAGALAARARPAAPPETLAYHYVESSRPELALPYVLPAIAALVARHENDAALRLAARVLSFDGVLVGRERAALLLRSGEIRNLVGDRDAQGAAAREALVLAEEARDPVLVARALCAVATHFTTTGGDRHAVPRYRASIRLARGAGDAAVEVRASIGISSALMRLGRSDEARTRILAACTTAEQIGDLEMEQHARRSLGLLDLRVARFEEAREVFHRCIEIARSTGDLRAEGHAAGGLGVVEWQAGNWDAARARFLEARDVARTVGDRSLEVHALGSLAICLQAVGRCVDAVTANRELRPLVESVGDRAGLALLLLNVCQAHLHLGEKEEARRALDEGAALAEATGFARSRAQAALCRGEQQQEAGDLEGAERQYLAAEAILAESDDPSGRAEALLSLGSVMRERGDTARAVAYFDEALVLGRTLARPATRVLAEATRATLPGGDVAAACASAELHLGDATYSFRMRIRLDLWLATRDRRQLEDARRLLAEFLDGIPAARRRMAVENFSLHRNIAAACAAAGLPPVC